MPRAKRTDRAEARRRNRAFTAQQEPALHDDGRTDRDDAGRVERADAARSAPPARPSIRTAFRESFHPLTLAEDVRTFPPLIRHKSVWLPILLTTVAGVGVTVVGAENFLTALIFQYFILPPAIGAVFLGGFLAPRSSYLVGLVTGLYSAIVYSILVSTVPAVAPETQEVVQQNIIYAFLSSALLGMFFASAAAWYRRFLHLSNPNRHRRPAARRGNDGRTRARTQPRPTSRR